MIPYLADPDATVYHGDCLDVLAELERESVDCIVTSPPYADARLDYDHVSAHEYGDWSATWLKAAIPVVKPTGGLLLNLGRLFRAGEEFGYWIDVLARARRVGWRWLDTLVWSKPNANPIRGRVFADSHEYVFVLGREDAVFFPDAIRTPYTPESLGRMGRRWSKHSVFKGNGRDQGGRTPNPEGARARSVVTVYVGGEKGNPHAAPMPLELALDLVRLACPHGGTVLDPFAGSGTTGRAARLLSRRAVLIEKNAAYCALIAQRLSQQSLLTEAS